MRQWLRGRRQSLRKRRLRRRGLREVCWFCHSDYAGSPCLRCAWSPARRVVFRDAAGKRYTNEVGASDTDPWSRALICMPGMGTRIALPLRIESATSANADGRV